VPLGLAPTAYYNRSPNYYAYYKQPAYADCCNAGPSNYYWRRNCWYDSFGRRLLQLTSVSGANRLIPGIEGEGALVPLLSILFEAVIGS
jgi:hypothetical protein